MNLLETYVTNITKVEVDLPYNSVRVTADFDDDAGIMKQDTRVLMMWQYQQVIAYGYYLS